MKNVIELKNVWKTYRMGDVDVHALRGINLGIKKGSFVAITGPSGSGKSTLMNLVGCLDLPSKGSVYLDRQDISHLDESTLAQIRGRKIGFIFQQFNLIPTLTALENVMLPMVFQGVIETTRIKRATELLTLVDLRDRMNHKPLELSGGQQQRVAIARAIVSDPKLLVCDEPTGDLDQAASASILELLQMLNRDHGKTIIMVTHDPRAALSATVERHFDKGSLEPEERVM